MIKTLSYIFGLFIFFLVGCSTSTPKPNNPTEAVEEIVSQSEELTEEEQKLDAEDAEYVKEIEKKEEQMEQQIEELGIVVQEESAINTNNETEPQTTEKLLESDQNFAEENDTSSINTSDQILASNTSENKETANQNISIETTQSNVKETETDESLKTLNENKVSANEETSNNTENRVLPEPALLPILTSENDISHNAESITQSSEVSQADLDELPEAEIEEESGLLGKIKKGANRLLGLFSNDEEEEKTAFKETLMSEPSSGMDTEPTKTITGSFEWEQSQLSLLSAKKLVSCEQVPDVLDKIHQQLEKTKNLDVADRRLRDSRSDTVMPVIHFDFDQNNIKPTYQALLRQQSSCVMDALESQDRMIVQIEGHADERGSEEYNMALGHRRASSVVNAIRVYLPKSTLIRTISYGEEFPLVRGSGNKAWSKNRRVEFTFLLKP